MNHFAHELLGSPAVKQSRAIRENWKEHAVLIRTAIRETAEAMGRATQKNVMQEHTVLIEHLKRLQDLENAVLGMATMPEPLEEE